MSATSTETHWTDRAFVSVAHAAEIVARSSDWVRTQVGEGRLDAARLAAGGPLVIRVDSLQRLIDAAAPVTHIQIATRKSNRPRLVVSNT